MSQRKEIDNEGRGQGRLSKEVINKGMNARKDQTVPPYSEGRQFPNKGG